MMVRRAVIVGLATAAAWALSGPGLPSVHAGPSARLGLSGTGAEVRWEDAVPDGAVVDPVLCSPRVCSITNVTLGERAPRLVVAVDTSQMENTFDFLYDITLDVYGPDGALAGRSSSNFESNVVVVNDAPLGSWRIVVWPESVVGGLRYKGYAAATVAPSESSEPHELLPNLVAQSPTNLGLRTAPAAGPPPFVWDFRNQIGGPMSCYAQEVVELGARRCLRFDQTVANLGEGPLELRAPQMGDGPMNQRIHRTDGTIREERAGKVRLHLQHMHFHYEDYAIARLFAVEVDGSRGHLVREGRKQGFCLADTRNMRFGHPDQTPAMYVEPVPCDGRNEAPLYSRVGITPGWADTYPWYIPEQFIEISGVPDGRYLLEFAVNEAGGLVESRHDDNVAGTMFDLRGDSVTVVPGASPTAY